MSVTHHPGRIVIAAFVVTILVGGANSIAVRFSLRELPVFWGATFRFLIATVVVGALVLALRRPWPHRRRRPQRRLRADAAPGIDRDRRGT